jgi:hypothetical protein
VKEARDAPAVPHRKNQGFFVTPKPQKGKITLKPKKKERTSFCEQKEAKKL